ncbi:hypothetical protein Kpho02_51070 [Kitasatospora phosalacinea]|uniref:Uncharacterized protein n=1 Tax=Kitasatospora phosalacinea TaxID=2065 RepID=A0A9W6QD47_9ACTN|nr:hypothetical protein [Kitasatospora phosalacinea]GLW72808.1 hypothetical protein Kpho02_51070 [Kitasatospora phosalacinea]
MSVSPQDPTRPRTDPDEPLPVMARGDAASWARELIAYLARSAGLVLAPGSVRPFFGTCTGRNGERAGDGRYTLAQHADGPLPAARHPAAVRALRAVLERDGFTVTAYRETVDGRPDALLYARHPAGRYFLDLGTGGGTDRFVLTVRTRCLRPPADPS